MQNKLAFIDGSRLMTEALVRSGADVFIGYPITPANLLYLYSSKRFPTFFAAPDEITTLQWMSGFAASGRIPVTATSFPGFALMLESINMAYMMELPMVIILVQRLGPSTGTATSGAQGDISLINGMLSGGYTIPTLSTSSMTDCWEMSEVAVKTAVALRSPVILLTSKEEVMTLQSYDQSALKEIKPVERKYYTGDAPYEPYKADEKLVPEFLPVTNTRQQVRLTASTHNQKGILQNTTKEALNNTVRIHEKSYRNLDEFLHFELNEQGDADTLLFSYGITAAACREAVYALRSQEKKISLLVAKTLLPVPDVYFNIINKYKKVYFAEENHTGLYRKIMMGIKQNENYRGINGIGKMINPAEIIKEVMSNE